MKKLLTILMLAALTGCAGAQTKERPDWVDGKTEAAYPSSKFRVAVGSGSSRDDAIESAKKQLAASFLEKVESRTSSENKSEFSENSAGQPGGSTDRNTRTVTQRSANVVLRGAQVVEFYTDSSGTTYALAILDKLKTRNSYLNDLGRMREKILSEYDTFKSQPDPKTGMDIIDRAAAYGDLAREATTIGTPLPGADPVSERDLQSIRNKLDEMKQSRAIGLELSAQGDEAQQEVEDLRSLVANCLQDKGYGIAPSGATPNVKFAGAYKVKTRPTKTDGYSTFQFSVTATLSHDKKSDHLFLPEDSSSSRQDQAFDNIKGAFSDAICGAIVKVL
jgi:LPP20 lipoprotein